ncbi:hypothetical protein CJU60_17535 [Bacillus sp. 7705b]|nr:hypothetical protein CJU60_17535 [Bacillus sp. 7705b]
MANEEPFPNEGSPAITLFKAITVFIMRSSFSFARLACLNSSLSKVGSNSKKRTGGAVRNKAGQDFCLLHHADNIDVVKNGKLLIGIQQTEFFSAFVVFN